MIPCPRMMLSSLLRGSNTIILRKKGSWLNMDEIELSALSKTMFGSKDCRDEGTYI
jgi:hypothetical protein